MRLLPYALMLPLALSGCGVVKNLEGSSPTSPATPATNPFASVVFIGDSLSAGFQNESLLDTQQPNGFANLVATQAKFAITLPLIAAPGVPAVLQLVSTGFPPVVQQESGVTTGRDNPTAQPTDLAVPGHMLHDVLNYAPPLVPTTGEDVITDLVLGLPAGNSNTQLAEAVALKPSTVFVWAGSDDALQADKSGTPTAMTSLSSFTSDFTQLMATLKSSTSANLVVANVPDVTAIPYMTPATTVISEVASLTGLPAAQVGSALGLNTGDLVNGPGLTDLQAQLQTLATGGSLTTLPDNEVLTAAEVATVQSTIASYNQVIAQQATAMGATLVDMHAFFATLSAGVTINGYNATTAFLGGLFSLDGAHPTNTGYALVANQFIATLNASFAVSIPAVDVSQVATTDPYFGSNIKPALRSGISSAAARVPAR